MLPIVAIVVTGAIALGAATIGALGVTATLPAALIFTVASTLLVAADIRSRRLPHRIVLPAIAASLAAQSMMAWQTGRASIITGALLGGFIAGSGMLAVHLVSPDGLGFGDVTYSALIGVTLGSLGMSRVGLGLGIGIMVGAVIAGPTLVVWRRRPAVIGPEAESATIPFGPALAAGGWIALCWGDTIIGLLK